MAKKMDKSEKNSANINTAARKEAERRAKNGSKKKK